MARANGVALARFCPSHLGATGGPDCTRVHQRVHWPASDIMELARLARRPSPTAPAIDFRDGRLRRSHYPTAGLPVAGSIDSNAIPFALTGTANGYTRICTDGSAIAIADTGAAECCIGYCSGCSRERRHSTARPCTRICTDGSAIAIADTCAAEGCINYCSGCSREHRHGTACPCTRTCTDGSANAIADSGAVGCCIGICSGCSREHRHGIACPRTRICTDGSANVTVNAGAVDRRIGFCGGCSREHRHGSACPRTPICRRAAPARPWARD